MLKLGLNNIELLSNYPKLIFSWDRENIIPYVKEWMRAFETNCGGVNQAVLVHPLNLSATPSHCLWRKRPVSVSLDLEVTPVPWAISECLLGRTGNLGYYWVWGLEHGIVKTLTPGKTHLLQLEHTATRGKKTSSHGHSKLSFLSPDPRCFKLLYLETEEVTRWEAEVILLGGLLCGRWSSEGFWTFYSALDFSSSNLSSRLNYCSLLWTGQDAKTYRPLLYLTNSYWIPLSFQTVCSDGRLYFQGYVSLITVLWRQPTFPLLGVSCIRWANEVKS